MNSDARYLSSSHAKYLTQYRLIWCPEYRFPVLEDGTDILLKEILYWIAGNYGFVTKALEVIPDHIHIFLDAPHTMAPCQIANIFQSISAWELFRGRSNFKQFYSRHGHMWSSSYFISSIGSVSEQTVRKYIEERKLHD